MRVCIDIQAGLGQRAGIGRYTKALVEQMVLRAAPDDVSLFHFDFRGRGCPFAPPGASRRAVRWLPGRVVQKLWMHGIGPAFDRLAGEAEIYFFPNFLLPPLRRGRGVVTLHDVSFLRHPETAEARNLRHLKARMGDTVRRAAAILTDSHFCAREIIECLHVPPDKVHAVPLGLEPSFRPPTEDDVAAYRRRAGLDRPYLLTVGTIEPRKNHSFLIKVFERIAGDADLVIAGPLGWKVEPILRRLAASPRAGRIRRLDYVSEPDLPALYAGAEVFLFPSLYEGFGFPPLEAMACGTPVLASARGALPETLGTGALMLNEYDASHWAGQVDAWLQQPGERRTWIERGRAWATRYTWPAAADATWGVLRSLDGLRPDAPPPRDRVMNKADACT